MFNLNEGRCLENERDENVDEHGDNMSLHAPIF